MLDSGWSGLLDVLFDFFAYIVCGFKEQRSLGWIGWLEIEFCHFSRFLWSSGLTFLLCRGWDLILCDLPLHGEIEWGNLLLLLLLLLLYFSVGKVNNELRQIYCFFQSILVVLLLFLILLAFLSIVEKTHLINLDLLFFIVTLWLFRVKQGWINALYEVISHSFESFSTLFKLAQTRR